MMTNVEKKLKKYEDCGYKLYKFYAEDEERDADIPDMLEYIEDLYDAMTKECSKLALAAVRSSTDYAAQTQLKEVKYSLDMAKDWLDTPPDKKADYYLARIWGDFMDLDIQPIETKALDVSVAKVVRGQVVLTPTSVQIQAYAVPVLGSWHCEYVLPEPYKMGGYPIIINPDTLEAGHPYADVRESILEHSHVCRDCEKIFFISPNEESFFTSKHLDLPKRCRQCRKTRKK